MIAHRKKVKTTCWVTRSGKQRFVKLYRAWANMKQRCLNPNNDCHHHYGGRGIAICEEWLSFGPFREWALANGYSRGLTIERIDNDRGYSPENCRLATRAEQTRNSRRNHYITFDGRTQHLFAWAREIGISHHGLRWRLRNWTLQDAMTKKKQW